MPSIIHDVISIERLGSGDSFIWHSVVVFLPP